MQKYNESMKLKFFCFLKHKSLALYCNFAILKEVIKKRERNT